MVNSNQSSSPGKSGGPPSAVNRETLGDEDRRVLESCAVEIDNAVRAAAWKLIEVGKQLKIAQDHLGPARCGLFAEWVEQRCGISQTSAYAKIQAFEKFQFSDRLENYQASAILLLSRDNVPPAAREEAEQLAVAGETVTKAKATEIVARRRRGPRSLFGEYFLPCDAKFVEAVNALAGANPEAHEPILSGKVKLPASAVTAVLKMPPEKLTDTANCVAARLVKSVAEITGPKPSPVDDAATVDSEAALESLQAPYRSAVNALNEIRRTLKALVEEEKSGAHLAIPWPRIRKAIEDAKTPIAQAMPAAWCPSCKGCGCETCKQTGWLPKSVWEGLPESERQP